jgi:tetratricopeptide (TPR) repeat protein
MGDQHRLGWVSVYLLAHFAQTCDSDRAVTTAQRVLAIAADLGEVGLTVLAQYYLGAVYRSLGDYHQAVECLQQNVVRLQDALLQERFGLPGLLSVLSRSFLVQSLAECGAFADAQRSAEEGIRIAEAADHPYSRAAAYWAMGYRALRQGDLAQAIPVLECALALAQGAHIQLYRPMIASALGAAYTLAGRSAEALPLLEQAVSQAMTMRFMRYHALQVAWSSETYLRAGRLEEANAQAQRALAFARDHQERSHEAYALWLLGEIHAHSYPPAVEPAATHYRQALVLAEARGMRPLQAHCHFGLGTFYAKTGQQEQAQADLSAAIDLYRGMGMTLWLPQAESTDDT